jgi:lauroyl/myristoyl acyltransferase
VTTATVRFNFMYCVPRASQAIANALPDSVVEQIGDSTLETLDDLWFEPQEARVWRCCSAPPMP